MLLSLFLSLFSHISDLHLLSTQSLNTKIYSHYLEAQGKTKGRLRFTLAHSCTQSINAIVYLPFHQRSQKGRKKKVPKPING